MSGNLRAKRPLPGQVTLRGVNAMLAAKTGTNSIALCREFLQELRISLVFSLSLFNDEKECECTMMIALLGRVTFKKKEN
jgi:hypothetical protein